jgi:hypothetical protein
MDLSPLNATAGAAGMPIAQTKGSDVERVSGETNAQRRGLFCNQKAAIAEGVGELDGDDFAISDRNGDGRLPWPESRFPEIPASENNPASTNIPSEKKSRGKDPTGQSGKWLDVRG